VAGYDRAVAPLVVGFDLDLTLIDSRPGIAAAYRALSARTGVYIDADAAVTRLGPPLEVELAMWFPAEQVHAVGDLYRTLYPLVAVTASPPLPGVTEAVDAVRQRGGRVVVITGKYAPNAHLHLDHIGLAADAVVGWAWADTKTIAMLDLGVGVYVGDHPADMAAARAAEVIAVGVLTGFHSAIELVEAGAEVVLEDLTGFAGWLDDRLAGPISVGLGGFDR
jgi:phosphoglycolate phosphatase